LSCASPFKLPYPRGQFLDCFRQDADKVKIINSPIAFFFIVRLYGQVRIYIVQFRRDEAYIPMPPVSAPIKRMKRD